MIKFQLRCSCIYCHTETTTQSLKAHIAKCTKQPANVCVCCGTKTNNPQYCSRSCRAKIVNAHRPKKPKHNHAELRKQRDYSRFLEGCIKERPSLRRYLGITQGYKCTMCGISEWNNNSITLIVDHINGDASNNLPSNLRLLCPNCNSQTPTFGGRNKGNGRKSRGLPLN